MASKKRNDKSLSAAGQHRLSSVLGDAVDNMIEGCQIIGPDWLYLYVNEAVAKQGKSSRPELVGHTMMEKYPGIDSTPMFAKLKECMEKRTPQSIENQFTYPDGSTGWFELRMEPVPQGVMILSLDISDHKLVEEKISNLNRELEARVKSRTVELNREKQRFETLLESIGDGVVAIDRSWNITLWNKAATLITGRSKTEAEGRPLRDILKFMKENDRRENIAFIEDAMVRGRSTKLSNKTILIKKDGSEIPVGDSAAPIFDSSKQVAGAIIIFRDISDEREAQSMRSDFAYAQHQIRTPITEVLWTLDGALDSKSLADTKKGIRIALQSLESVTRLTEELIEVSALDQQTIAPRLKSVLLPKLINSAVERVKAHVEKATVDISAMPALTIETDPSLFARILYELIINAVRFGISSRPASLMADLRADGLVIEISNQGTPISEEQQPLVFTKFFRGSNADPSQIGAGLGLYIAREYARSLGGKIWFNSDDNRTTFSLLLPVNQKGSNAK